MTLMIKLQLGHVATSSPFASWAYKVINTSPGQRLVLLRVSRLGEPKSRGPLLTASIGRGD